MSFGKEDIDICTLCKESEIIDSPEVDEEKAGFVVKGYQHFLLRLVASSSCLDVT